MSDTHQLTWVTSDGLFPDPIQAWGPESDAPGLLAVSQDLTSDMLLRAYPAGIFPWYSPGQPVLWWMPEPRMMLDVKAFRVRRSLVKTLRHFRSSARCEIRIDHNFRAVLEACASTPRTGQAGTWITPEVIDAYDGLHRKGYAHCVETWINGELVGGLYCVNIGKAVFGESMFAWQTDASKIALAALVAFCRTNDIPIIDCQQTTRHLASLGATEFNRPQVRSWLNAQVGHARPVWTFDRCQWDAVLPQCPLT